MRLTKVEVRNFKGLREVVLPFSHFVCIIGPNNAGKSSLLQSLLLFVEGKRLTPSHYYNENEEITITVRLEDITGEDLARLAPEHRAKTEPLIVHGTITLVRRYGLDGSSRLRYIARVPADGRFSDENLDALLKGKKPSAAFAAEVITQFRELADQIDARSTQTHIRDRIAALAKALPETEKTDKEVDLPSGIDNSIRALLPEPIYIPAVKDLTDEIKTKESASFGRLLGILLSVLKPQLSGAEEVFKDLNKALNRVADEGGLVVDERLEAVKNVETSVERFVQENFSNVTVEIKIPPPELKTVLSSAEILLDDGVIGTIETKGDGLKRAVTFAVLRSYVEMRKVQDIANEVQGSAGYLFLFEEPELYLHPVSQRALFDALGKIARTNHVVVSTHSPMFFASTETGTFVKIVKRYPRGEKPFGYALPVDLSALDNKARFQLISYETNNTAFFGEAVVLIEGDSDYLVVPHLSALLNPEWSFERAGIALCRIHGKSSIRRYREFFEAFEVPVLVLGDLDCLLDGFEQLGLPNKVVELRADFLQRVDRAVEGRGAAAELTADDLKRESESATRRVKWEKLKAVYRRCLTGEATAEEVTEVGDEFFSSEQNKARLLVMRDESDPDLLGLKRRLLKQMRDYDVYLWERGTIESYFPAEIAGPDKVSRALDFCRRINTREQAIGLCSEITVEGDTYATEFDEIFAQMFGADRALE